MKRLILLIAALQLAGCATEPKPVAIATPTGLQVEKVEVAKKAKPPQVAGAAQPGGAIEWDASPDYEKVSEYRVYRLAGGSPPKLEGTSKTTTFRPAKKGTFYVTAVNGGGESVPSEEIKL